MTSVCACVIENGVTMHIDMFATDILFNKAAFFDKETSMGGDGHLASAYEQTKQNIFKLQATPVSSLVVSRSRFCVLIVNHRDDCEYMK